MLRPGVGREDWRAGCASDVRSSEGMRVSGALRARVAAAASSHHHAHAPSPADHQVSTRLCGFSFFSDSSSRYAGYDIPEGTLVAVSVAAANRLPEIYSNPDAFEPERFAEPRAEHKKSPYAFLSFGGGSKRVPLVFGLF